MIDIRPRGSGKWRFFYITDTEEQLEIEGIADSVMAIVLGYADPVWWEELE